MKAAFITGTTRGLGKALSSVYSANGWDVVPLSRPKFDLMRPDMERIEPGHDDAVFINNAATVLIAPRFTDQQIIDELTVNLVSPIWLIQRFVTAYPHGAVVVNITSGLARNSLPHFDLYCTAKAGMEAYIRSLQSKGIRCINFDPGVIDTDMQLHLRSAEHPEKKRFIGYSNEGLLKDPRAVAVEVFAKHQEFLTP